MRVLEIVNTVIAILFFVCYFYQFVYVPIPFLKKKKFKGEIKQNKLAILICARNEENVITDLIDCIWKQTYNRELLTVFVMADNCDDKTAEFSRRAGAVVYERHNTKLIGKGYALNLLLENISRDYPDGFDGYIVFDADNLLKEDYIENMNRVFCNGYDIVTSYRNSKNFGQNWISAGYALWFLRESVYLNYSRMLVGSSCAVSGTGFMFSRKVLEEQGHWPFHLLTEDIEFSVHHILQGYKIGMAKDAVLYDEQPTTFRQSWRQRLRWACGFLQVFKKYGGKLVKGVFKGSFSCFDMSMNIMPAAILTIVNIISNIALFIMGIKSGNTAYAVNVVLRSFCWMYFVVFAVGLITVITEWKMIYVKPWKKILYTFTFPLFMFTYIPITFVAFFKRKVTWKPITHHKAASSVPTETVVEAES